MARRVPQADAVGAASGHDYESVYDDGEPTDWPSTNGSGQPRKSRHKLAKAWARVGCAFLLFLALWLAWLRLWAVEGRFDDDSSELRHIREVLNGQEMKLKEASDDLRVAQATSDQLRTKVSALERLLLGSETKFNNRLQELEIFIQNVHDDGETMRIRSEAMEREFREASALMGRGNILHPLDTGAAPSSRAGSDRRRQGPLAGNGPLAGTVFKEEDVLYRVEGAATVSGLYRVTSYMLERPMYKQRDGPAVIYFEEGSDFAPSFGWGWRLDSRSAADTRIFVAPNSTRANKLPPAGVWLDLFPSAANLSVTVAQEEDIDRGQERAFSKIAKEQSWGSQETISGHGSEMLATTNVRKCLGEWIARYDVRTLLDAPCGDGHWQGRIPGIEGVEYHGYDIAQAAVHRAVAKNAKQRPGMRFEVFDITQSVPTVTADLIVMRDFLQHVPLKLGLQALKNAKAAKIKFLAVSTYDDPVHRTEYINVDVKVGGMYYNNVQAPPFGFGRARETCDNYDPGTKNSEKEIRDSRLMLFDLQSWEPGLRR